MSKHGTSFIRPGKSDEPGGLMAELKARYLEERRQLVLSVIEKSGGNKTVAAQALGVNRTTFVMLLKNHFPHMVQEGPTRGAYHPRVGA